MTFNHISKATALANPVTLREFAVALSKTWGTTNKANPSRTIGLAISGGVDSMALAALCLKVKSSASVPSQMQFRAFVIDHAARPSSSEEAIQVVQVLEQKGIPGQVLNVAWEGQLKPSELSNFESLARKHRYQLLGKACKQHGITSLLVAHHQDDQAETVLMRILAGQRGPALQGIKGENGIPECYGLHGIWESGEISTTTFGSVEDTGQLQIETGGIRIQRPLLGFSKDRLIATCEAEDMTWFEDQSNQDPTLTTRNAIRHLYRVNKVPSALSKDRLLHLTERCHAAATLRDGLKKHYLAKCEVTRFASRSGTIIIKFSDLNDHDLMLAATLLRHIIMLITPEEHVSVSSLHGAVKHVFDQRDAGQSTASAIRFNVAGVLFESLKEDITLNNYTEVPKRTPQSRWLICRQTYLSSVPKPSFSVAPCPPQETVWSDWQLWDGRYWIRLVHHFGKPLVIRPFSPGDVAKFRRSLSLAGAKNLRRYFATIAKGAIRYTLPCIVAEDNGEETVVGLPSLDLYSSSAPMKCQIRYKKIYLDGLSLQTGQEKSQPVKDG
ncbi:Adenine nucleotide alpha hydrolases-like protein [Glarea lozoyensis ATCC 20868]|uniref:tRNA(Ile)-lysidine synthetase n=1 Tax=Glarea lozoyensis (strain ATCC 20868 / MF5171) TaxID=1116229 RepID=S3CKP6_GLAL2|nr:Adenine nucleotide alpha hydrolases-like protein [Glarea lozoyensis ATCC 20868]EPE25769.1 Adenine nucleotide alpha hydrolases-like protein [Glarea lozoyensis ATCC 20868]